MEFGFIILYILFLQSLLIRLFGHKFGITGIIYIIRYNFFILLVVSYTVFIMYVLTPLFSYQCILNLGSWFQIADLFSDWVFMIDTVSYLMGLVVLTISAFVHLYSVNYLENDPFLIRFLGYLSLFTSFMLLMVFSLNLVVFFLGWEGIGLCSYLLISFWSTRVQAVKAALKAILVNRIGDFFFLVGLGYCFLYLRSVDLDVISTLAPYFTTIKVHFFFKYKVSLLDLIGLCFSFAAIGKSAQLGLHIWLPDAMEGPTPVSALIHAATMVTAGIFLLLRLNAVLILSNFTLNFLIIVGSLTTFISALIAITQFDIKKIIAYSTCSQLGYMFLSIGLLNFSGSFYHLVNHAFFKALLFLSAGAIIHGLNGEQDVRKMGGLIKIFPFYYFCILISSFSMCGLFFLSGFFSKEYILTYFSFFSSSSSLFLFSYWLSLLTTILTALYSIRLLYEVFYGEFKGSFGFFLQIHYNLPVHFKYPLTILCLLSLFSGYFLKSIFLGNSLALTADLPIMINQSTVEYIPIMLRIIPVFFSLIGLILFYFYYYFFYEALIYKYKNFYLLLSNKFFFDAIINYFCLSFLIKTRALFLLFDKGILEIFGPSGSYYFIKNIVNYNLFRMYNNNNFYLHVFFLFFISLISLSFITIYIHLSKENLI